MGHVLAELWTSDTHRPLRSRVPRIHCEGDLDDVRIEPFFPIPADVREHSRRGDSVCARISTEGASV